MRAIRADRYGRRGDKQDGIDFDGELSDERTADWQCKRYKTFAPADVRTAVKKNTHVADVHYLVLSCEASSDVRDEIDEHPGWVLLDKRALGRLVEDLPRHKQREVLDKSFGPIARRRLMSSPGQDALPLTQGCLVANSPVFGWGGPGA